jgi:hypothetical protein
MCALVSFDFIKSGHQNRIQLRQRSMLITADWIAFGSFSAVRANSHLYFDTLQADD